MTHSESYAVVFSVLHDLRYQARRTPAARRKNAWQIPNEFSR
jgi:hypothetical protein